MFEPSSNRKRIHGRHRPRRTMLARPPRRSKTQRGALARAGATLVEFAIVCNILLLTIFMCMELARMNMARNLAQDAAYYAARTAIVPGATAEEARQEAETIMQSLFANGYEIECTEIDDDAEEVTVTVSINLDDVALFTPMFLGNIQLTSSATMQTERYNGFFRVDN